MRVVKRLDNELLPAWEVIKLSPVANVGSTLAWNDTSFVEHVARLLK